MYHVIAYTPLTVVPLLAHTNALAHYGHAVTHTLHIQTQSLAYELSAPHMVCTTALVYDVY